MTKGGTAGPICGKKSWFGVVCWLEPGHYSQHVGVGHWGERVTWHEPFSFLVAADDKGGKK